ncbi:MAG: glycolate oxidase subunit GlcE [Halioglobus sp.]
MTSGTPNTDQSQALCDAVSNARSAGTALRIHGGNTKEDCIGRMTEAQTLSQPLDITRHSGITNYEPGELVLTARAGTPIAALQAATAAEGQTLAFEPPSYGGRATLGGTLACNLSGPARPWAGSIRDHVLGITLINGKAELLNFGGRVMKNVAGYDVSRAQAGALGTLGVITEVSLKVMPKPEASTTLRFELPVQEAVAVMNQRAAQPKPLNGACWFDGKLFLRLEGTSSAVEHTARQWGGEALSETDTPWAALREFELPFFSGNQPLWRLSVGATSAIDNAYGSTLLDWGGAQRWLRGEHDLDALQALCDKAQGHATLYRGGDRTGEVRTIGNSTEQRLHQRLKHAFDPDNVFNPGRLYSWL